VILFAGGGSFPQRLGKVFWPSRLLREAARDWTYIQVGQRDLTPGGVSNGPKACFHLRKAERWSEASAPVFQ